MSGQDLIEKQLKDLRDAKRNKNSTQCLQVIAVLNDYFDMPKSTSETKYAVELLLKENDKKIDLPKLIITAITLKNLQEAAVRTLELIQKVTVFHPLFVKPFSKNVIDVCLQTIKCHEPSARFKEMAVKTLDEILSRDALPDDDKNAKISAVIKVLLSVFDQDVKSRLFNNTFELLGKISKMFPDQFTPESAKKLLDKMLTVIQNLFKDDKASVSLILISGAVEGLRNHLENFTPKDNEDAHFKKRLYECMLLLSDPFKHSNINSDSNRVAFRNMLSVVTHYSHLVNELIYEDHSKWHAIMLQWIASKNYDDKNAGVHCMQAIHVEIGKCLEKENNPADKAILLFYMNYFQKTLESPQSQPHEIRIAIKGFGSMAGAAKILLEPGYLNERFDLVMQRTEYSYYVGNKMKRREVLEHLPNYIEALSKIINQIDEISGIQLHSLQAICVILVKDFYFLSTSHHNLVAAGLLETFANLEKTGGKVFSDTVESITWQGILWTCSHQLTYDLESNYENIKDWKDTITYKRYLPLWSRLLKPSDERHKRICSSIYEHFIKSLFQIIDKLNLDTKKRKYHDESTNADIEFFFTDPSLDLEAVRPEDFQILYNLTQFYNDIITHQTNEELEANLSEWLDHWLEKSISLALKHPLVSAFMYLIEIALRVMERLDYIRTKSIDSRFSESRLMETLSSYIKSLFSRSKQVSDELQIACLRLIFQSPIVILKEHIEETISVLITGFSVGKSVINLAHHALTCYQNMIGEYNSDPKMRRRLLEEVLPHLETFLSSGKELATDSELRELKYKRQRKRIVLQSVDTDLMKLKKRILLLLGTCTPEESQLILTSFQQKLTRDYITNIFDITLHCDDELAPLIHLDQIIERVCHIALHSSDRPTKISGCELVHGMVLYMMGKNLKKSETLPIWKDLCKNIIILGAEKDQTIRALFEPLLMQMMHYYSKPDQILSPLSTVMIEAVLEMISYRDNSIQDLSARLLREYIIWLMRQTSKEQRKLSPITLVDFFHELKKMSIETEQSRRMGATLAFNNIYRVIREEEALIDVYWIYLLDVFCLNFKSTEDFSDHLDNCFVDNRRFQQISSTLDHLTRVFIERSDIFQRANRDRIKPFGFNGITLNDVLNWLFEQCIMEQYFYRRKCMDIFLKIMPENGPKDDYYRNNWNVEKILKIGEHTGMSERPDLKFLRDTSEPIFKETYNWMKNFLRLLDFYHWLLQNELLPQKDIAELLSKSVATYTIEYFLKNVMVSDLTNLVRSIDENLINSTQLSYEAKMQNRNLEKIYVTRNVILATILDFLEVSMNMPLIKDFLASNEDTLISLIENLFFKPHELNYDYKSQCIIDLPSRLVKFISTLSHRSPLLHGKLMKVLENKVAENMHHLSQSCAQFLNSKGINENEENKLKGISMIISNFKIQMDISSLQVIARELLSKLFESLIEENMHIMRPRCLKHPIKKFFDSIMRVCLKIDTFLEELVTFALNGERLKITDQCSIGKGEHFLQTFKNTILRALATNNQSAVALFVAHLNDSTSNNVRIINILAELNEFIYKYYNHDSDLLNANIHTIISIWPTIMKAVHIMNNSLNCVDLAIINLVTHVAMICPYELHLLGQRLEEFQKWLLEIFDRKENSLEIKSKAIFLLPCITHSDDKDNDELMKALNKIRDFHLPFRSAEFPEGSIQRSGFVVFTNAIFQALLTSKSPVIFKFIIHITINDEKYVLEEKLQKTQQDLMLNLSEKEQETFLIQTFDAFLNDQLDPEIRLTIVSRYLLTIMKNCRVDTMMTFMRQKVAQIWQLLDTKFDFDSTSAFVSRSGAYMIIEAFAASVPKDKIESGTYLYNGNLNNGLTFIKELIMKAKDVRRDVVFVVDDPKQQEIFRQFQCYCYRALATMVANTKDLPEVFNLCLFQENPATRSFIWRKLINVLDENLYSNWSQDFEDFPKVKEYIVSIKELDANAAKAKQSKYIEKMSIFDRSLSQTLTKTDLSYSVILTNRERLKNDQMKIENQEQMRVNLESIPVNDHEIMGILVATINSIFARKLSIIANFDNADKKKYEWVLSIAKSLMNPEQHKNVKLFLAKLIDNCRQVFSYYAQFLLEPILSILTDDSLGFTTMNFFITDLTTMLLSWNHVYKPTKLEERESAGMLLKFLMQNAYHERNEIFRMNLELIKRIVESWNEVLVGKIPTQILLDMLHDSGEVKLICGIQLNAVVLANNLVPWSNNEQCEQFIKAILISFNNGNPKVHQPASQLMGMCLNAINNEECTSIVRKKLEKIQSQRDKSEVFLQLLYGIQKTFPSMLDTFMRHVIQSIPSAIRKIKCIHLEMFLARMEIFKNNVYRELTVIQLKNLLKQTEYQIHALHILNRGLEFFAVDQFVSFYDDLIYLVTSADSNVRSIIYEIMIFSIEKFKDNLAFDKIMSLKVILKGFEDSDQEIQNRVIKFFNENSGLSGKMQHRFDELLSSYYDPKLEKEFLHYATQLLLEISVKHSRSKRKLLDYDSRNDINFFEVPISTKSSYSQRMLPPMFIGSQQRQLLAGDGSQYSQMIRATQLNSNDSRMFEPTQDPNVIEQVSSTFQFAQTQNSLFVSLKPQYLSRRSSFTPQIVEEESLAMQIQRNKQEKTSVDSLDYLRRRIVKRSVDQKSREYALRAVDRRDFAEASKREKIQKLKQGKDVVLYRRYRVGDYPDFFFNSLAILLPLQALVKKDIVIARHIFISIFTALVSVFREHDDLESEGNFYASINASVLHVLKNSKESNSYLLAALVEMVIKSQKYLDISPHALRDSLSITGILFVESQLNHLNQYVNAEGEVDNRVKRVRLDDNDIKLQHWIRLVDFSHKNKELDTVKGILEDNLNLSGQVKLSLLRAVECEANNAYKEAMTLYSDLLTNQCARNNSEKDLYYNSYFSCLENLNDWDLITETAQKQINSYEDIWDEKIPFHQTTILPMLLKGELRKIIDGETNDGFLAVMEDWLSDENRSEHLLRKFPEEIAMLNVLDQNYTACCVEMDKTLHSLSDEWSHLEMYEDKIRLLSMSRNLAEITNFVNLMADTDASVYRSKQLEKICQGWRISMPKSADSLVIWNDLIAYRKTFLALATSQFSLDDSNRQLCESYLIDTERNLLEVSFAQKNADTAKMLIAKLRSQLQDSTNENVLKYNLAFGKYVMMIAEQESLGSFSKAIKRYGNAWDSLKNGVLDEEYLSNFSDIKIDTLCCTSQISLKLMKLYQKLDDEDSVDSLKEGFCELMGVGDSSSNMIKNFLHYGEEALKNAKTIAQNVLDMNYSPEKEIQLGVIHLKLGQYYRFVFAEKISDTPDSQLTMIKSIFRAIAYGQDDAKIYIPYILSQLPVLMENKITSEFNKQIEMVPLWIFIPYISHILSNFNFESDCFLDELTLNLAKKYPNALYYPFKLSRENFHHVNEGQIMEKLLVNEISNLVSSPIMDSFTSALQCLVIPEKMCDIHFQNFHDNISEKYDNEKYQAAVQETYDKIFTEHSEMQGEEFGKIRRSFSKKILDLKKFNWDTERDAAYRSIRALLRGIINASKPKIKTIDLSKLCSWLAEYKWSGTKDFLEVPGQYKGLYKPFIENHVKIVRFETRLNVFNSKQLPIEVKMYGSDGNSYKFIIKYGEDLRQDQRIQEVMDLMSGKLNLDKNCKQNRLKLDTYQVIPINSTCGLLQMVNNATTITEFMQKGARPFLQDEFFKIVENIRTKFRDFFLDNTEFTGWISMYEEAMFKSREQLEEIFDECASQVPNNIIQKALRGLSLTLQSYFILRKNFITSLSAMNAAHWLLGIGDRHLSNMLLNTSSGRLIAIDFGIAFGTAAALGVPELIPFRLTPHFVGVLEPIKTNGMIKENMIHTLKCFRNHKETILICLEVFIKEPTLDWLKQSRMRKSAGIVSDRESNASSVWDPEVRVNIVKKKLEGGNPMKLLVEELASGESKSKVDVLRARTNLIFGEVGGTRNKLRHEDMLRAEDQIECLIEMATDKAILATTYVGWDSWF